MHPETELEKRLFELIDEAAEIVRGESTFVPASSQNDFYRAARGEIDPETILPKLRKRIAAEKRRLGLDASCEP